MKTPDGIPKDQRASASERPRRRSNWLERQFRQQWKWPKSGPWWRRRSWRWKPWAWKGHNGRSSD
jgi:hypothetical protein